MNTATSSVEGPPSAAMYNCAWTTIISTHNSTHTIHHQFTTVFFPRCAIPECDGPDPVYEPSWALNALPAVQGRGFSNCRRFALLSNTTVAPPPNTCPASLFDRNTQVDCEEYVYGKTNSVVYDVSFKFFLG